MAARRRGITGGEANAERLVERMRKIARAAARSGSFHSYGHAIQGASISLSMDEDSYGYTAALGDPDWFGQGDTPDEALDMLERQFKRGHPAMRR